MIQSKNYFKKILLLLSFSMFFACDGIKNLKEEEDKKEAQNQNDDPGNVLSTAGTLIITGTLALDQPSSSLTDFTFNNFDIHCKSIETYPEECTIEVSLFGGISGDCSKLADKTITCNVRENGKVVGELPINGTISNLITKGTLDISVLIDLATGKTTAETEEGSDATDSEATAAVAETKVKTAWETGLEGEWQIECLTDLETDTFSGSNYCPDGKKIYLSKNAEASETDDHDGLYSLWDRKDIHDACLADSGNDTFTENSPNWHVLVEGDAAKKVAFAFSKLDDFATTMDAILDNMPAGLKESIETTADDINFRAGQFRSTIQSIRAATDSNFGGVLQYRVPSITELKRRLTLRLLFLKEAKLKENLDYCMALRNDDTLLSAYRRIHSVEPELICQLRNDSQIDNAISFVSNTIKSSCLPKIFYDVVYNSTSKEEELVLFCPGSELASGNCFNESGDFVGNIQGRYQIMRQKLGYDHVFELFGSKIIEKTVVHPKEGIKSCKVQATSALKGQKVGENQIEAVFSDHPVDRCEGSGASQIKRDYDGTESTTSVERYARTWKAIFRRVE